MAANTTRELGVGIVGFGFIGRVHAFSHAALPYFYWPLPVRTRIVGVCAATEATCQRAKEQTGAPYVTTDFRELIARPDVDIIHCCTPNDMHREVLLAALAAGKHIYCDKPLARSVSEAQDVVDVARTVPTVQRMTFNYRFVPATLRAKQIVEDGRLGEVRQFRAAYLHSGYLDPNRPAVWRNRMARSGGGAIMDLGVHIIDLMRHLLGDYESVNAQLRTVIDRRPDPVTGQPVPIDVDDIAIAQVRMRSGAMGVVEASRLATGAQDELRFEIHGSRGALAFNLMNPNWLTFYDATVPEGDLGGDRGAQRIECVGRYPAPYAFGANKNSVGWPQLHVACLYDFIAAVAANRPSGPSFEDALAAQRVVDACQRSSAYSSWVTV